MKTMTTVVWLQQTINIDPRFDRFAGQTLSPQQADFVERQTTELRRLWRAFEPMR